MAFPTLQQIAALERPSGLQALAGALTSGYNAYNQADQARQKKEAIASGAAKESQAANFLQQAVAEQDPAKSEALVSQAFSLSPDLVGKFFDIQKSRAQGADKSGFEREKLDLRKEESRLRALELAWKGEENKLKRQALEQKVELQKEKVSQAREESKTIASKKESSIQMANEAADLADEIAGASNLGDITGTITTEYAAIRPESQDLINKAQRLQSLLTVDNLKLMSGVLTDKDIQLLTNIASGLNVAEGGIKGSAKGVKERLESISRKIRQGLGGEQMEATETTVIEWGSL